MKRSRNIVFAIVAVILFGAMIMWHNIYQELTKPKSPVPQYQLQQTVCVLGHEVTITAIQSKYYCESLMETYPDQIVYSAHYWTTGVYGDKLASLCVCEQFITKCK